MVLELLSDIALRLLGYGVFTFYLTVGLLVCMVTFLMERIDSVKYPWFVRSRQLGKKCFEMMFNARTYDRDEYDEEAVRKGNEYVDNLVYDMIQNNSEDYVPYNLDGSLLVVTKKIGFVNINGKAKFDGYINGLSSLHRSRDSFLYKEDNELKIKANLAAGLLDSRCLCLIDFMGLSRVVTFEGTMHYIDVHMEFTLDSETGRKGRLDKLIVEDIKGMKVWVSGLGFLNWIVNLILRAFIYVLKRFVQNTIENYLETRIRQRLPSFQFPQYKREINKSIVVYRAEVIKTMAASPSKSSITLPESREPKNVPSKESLPKVLPVEKEPLEKRVQETQPEDLRIAETPGEISHTSKTEVLEVVYSDETGDKELEPEAEVSEMIRADSNEKGNKGFKSEVKAEVHEMVGTDSNKTDDQELESEEREFLEMASAVSSETGEQDLESDVGSEEQGESGSESESTESDLEGEEVQ